MKKYLKNIILGVLTFILSFVLIFVINSNKNGIIVAVGIKFFDIVKTANMILILLSIIWSAIWTVIYVALKNKKDKSTAMQFSFYSPTMPIDKNKINDDLIFEKNYALNRGNEVIFSYVTQVYDSVTKIAEQCEKIGIYIEQIQNRDPLLRDVLSTLITASDMSYKKASINILNRLNFLKNTKTKLGYDYDQNDLKSLKEDVDEFSATTKSCVSLSKKAIQFSIDSKESGVSDNEMERQALEQVMKQLSTNELSISKSLWNINI